MKILIVAPGRLPVPAVRGGAVETLITQLLDFNEKENCQELFVATIGNTDARKLASEYKNTRFFFVPQGRIVTYLSDHHLVPYRWLDWYFAKKAVLLIKSKKVSFDRIVIENEYVNGRVMQRAIPGNYIYHAHNDIEDGQDIRRQQFFDGCHKVVGISSYICKRFGTVLGHPNTVTVYNGIDTEAFCKKGYGAEREKLRAAWGITEEEVVIVYAGRLSPEKGIEQLLRSFIQLPPEIPARLLIIGASFFGTESENSFIRGLKQLCEGKKDKIIFTGYIPHEKLPAYYSAADIGCVPSVCNEAFGLAAAEQMAMELPVIATDGGALPEVVSEACGITVSMDEQLCDHLAEAMIKLAADENLRRELGEAGRRIVCEKFKKDDFCRKWFQITTME